MRNLLCGLALATVTLAAPADARDHQFYAGTDVGVLIVPDVKSKGPDFTESGPPPIILLQAAVPAASSTRERVKGSFGTGTDIDLVFGYDFGRVRAEAELARKRARFDSVTVSNSFFGSILDGEHDTKGSINALSAMVNVLYDLAVGGGASLYVGPGIGYGRVKLTPRVDLFDDGTFGDELHRTKRSGFMAQVVAGVRVPVSATIDIGLKYRYIRSEKLSYDAGVLGDLKGRLQTHSILASLSFNFGGHSLAVPVAVPAESTPAQAAVPASQTCADGSKIPASAVCPAPVPPAPASSGERG